MQGNYFFWPLTNHLSMCLPVRSGLFQRHREPMLICLESVHGPQNQPWCVFWKMNEVNSFLNTLDPPQAHSYGCRQAYNMVCGTNCVFWLSGLVCFFGGANIKVLQLAATHSTFIGRSEGIVCVAASSRVHQLGSLAATEKHIAATHRSAPSSLTPPLHPPSSMAEPNQTKPH